MLKREIEKKFNFQFHLDIKLLETVEMKLFEAISSEINNEPNWLLDLYKTSKTVFNLRKTFFNLKF